MLLGFVYSGITLYITKYQKLYLAENFDNLNLFVPIMCFILLFIMILNTFKLSNLHREVFKNPGKIIDMLYTILFETFIGSTLYVYFTAMTLTVLPQKVSNILNTKYIILNVLLLACIVFKMRKKASKISAKTLAIYSVVGIIIITQLSTIDILLIALYFIFCQINNNYQFKIKPNMLIDSKIKIEYIFIFIGILLTITVAIKQMWVAVGYTIFTLLIILSYNNNKITSKEL